MNEIIIIGTNPPCPRCGLLSKVIEAKISELNIQAEIKNLSYTDNESIEFARSIGLKAGTAKDVASIINQPINPVILDKLVSNSSANHESEFAEYNDCNWTPELDKFLEPYQAKATEAGILMTPVLIINGNLKHRGSVPPLKKINNWLMELL